jgi:hypothetical protein
MTSFAMITTILTRNKILITDAKGWRTKDYPDEPDFYGFVERKISSYNQKFNFKYHLCEKNNIGTTVINSLKFRYHIPVIGITTSNNITNERVLRSGKAFNKNDTIAWINRLRAAGVIELPRTMTPGLKLMQEHLDNFGAKKKNGKIVYEALHGHDDFVTCLNLAVNFAMKKFLSLPDLKKSLGLVTAGISSNQYYGSALQDEAMELAKRTLEKRGITPDDINILNSW